MITVEDLSFTYPGAREQAVRGVSFTVGDGEIFGLLGPSGAGKSTTQKILIKLLPGYQGKVSVLGKSLNKWGQGIYEKLGVCFEFPNHYLKLTALENLNYIRALYKGPTEDPMALLERLGLENDAKRPVGHFSKGMKIRLNLARALLHRPALLFLDEPTAGLDPALARSVRQVIRDERLRGATIFLTTHDMMVADDLCDRVGFMVDGEIRHIDSPETLKLKHGRRAVRAAWEEDGVARVRDFPLDGLGDDEAFLDLIRTKHIDTLHSQEPTLEDIFIAVTGRELG